MVVGVWYTTHLIALNRIEESLLFEMHMSDAESIVLKSISTKLSPVATNFSLKEHIYGVLRTAIMEMDIYNDDIDLRLDERKLAERLGTSRTPIREALAKLEHCLLYTSPSPRDRG